VKKTRNPEAMKRSQIHSAMKNPLENIVNLVIQKDFLTIFVLFLVRYIQKLCKTCVLWVCRRIPFLLQS